ncbi:MAG: CapA family protein [Clostridiales bacterium]|nr:CapA family protein [Clostridiales bacterium]
MKTVFGFVRDKRGFFCVAILCAALTAGCSGAAGQGGGSYSTAAARVNPPTVSFICVGDNLIHEQIWRSRSKEADGRYDFSGLYAPVKELVTAADVAFVNQETVCGGEALTLSDWPQFNSPQEILDALAKTGFTWISTANNHALDRGEEGIQAQLDYLSKTKGVVSTGTHATRKDSATPRVITVNGVRVGLASYTFGTNGIAPPPGKEYLVDVADEAKIRADLDVLAQKSDVQVVAMHWGDEGSLEPSDTQRGLAQMLADSGVDVVVGTHPHVFQAPVFLEGAGGNRTLVYYSLGNFMSSQAEPDRMLGAMAYFEIEYDAAAGEIRFLAAGALPLVTHISSDYQAYGVYPLGDYTEGLAAGHALAEKGLSLDSLSSRARELFGESGYWE